MSITEPTLLSLARASAIALATLAVLLIGGPGVQSWSRKMRVIFFWFAVAVLLAPGFAVAVTHFDDAMKQDAFGRERFYSFLVWLRLSPLALLVAWLTPPALSAEAMHCLLIGTPLPWWRRRMWELRAWGRGLWLGVAVVFLLAFQEFEIATAWNMRAWTVTLFDAQVGGLALGESLRLALLPLGIQAALVCTLVRFMQFVPQSLKDCEPAPESIRAVSPMLFFFGLAPVCFTPCLAMFGGLATLAVASHFEIFALAPWRQILNGLALAASATLSVWLLAGWIERRRGWRWMLALPGLLGPLLCGLMLLAVLQVPPLHLLRDTVFPPVLGLALVLLPFALLLRFGIETTRDRAALHTARTSGGRRAVWQLDGWPRLCAVLMLFCFGYGDFTINSLLAPPQFTSASVRLLNLLHYGRSDALMVMFILAFAVPLAAALLTALIARLYPRRRAS